MPPQRCRGTEFCRTAAPDDAAGVEMGVKRPSRRRGTPDATASGIPVGTGVKRWLCFGEGAAMLCAMLFAIWFSSTVVGAAETGGLIGTRALPNSRSRGPVTGQLPKRTDWPVRLLALRGKLEIAEPLLGGKLGVVPVAGILAVAWSGGKLDVADPDACVVEGKLARQLVAQTGWRVRLLVLGGKLGLAGQLPG